MPWKLLATFSYSINFYQTNLTQFSQKYLGEKISLIYQVKLVSREMFVVQSFSKMQRSCSSLLLICKRRPKGPVELSESTGESFEPKLLNKSCNFFDIGNFLKGILFAPWHLWFASKFAKFPATAIFIAQTSCDLREYLCSSIDSQGL